MAEYVIQDSTLASIGDAIRGKTGGSSTMTPAQMVTAIESISGGGSDISPFKVVKGTITPSENTQVLTFPCGDITSAVYFCVARVVNFESYISADNEGMGIGRVYYNFDPYFGGRKYNGSSGGRVNSVYYGAFEFWNAPDAPTINATNQTAGFAGKSGVTFKAGIPIEYVMLGV